MDAEKSAIQDYQGEIDPTQLIPRMGSSFKNVEGLEEIVQLLDRWQYRRALAELENRIVNDIQLIDSLLLKGELLALFDYNYAAIEVFEAVVEQDPENIYALTMILVQLLIVGENREKTEAYFTRLRKVSPHLHDEFKDTLRFIEDNKTDWDFQQIDEPLDLICVFGYFLNDDGSLPAKLEKRLQKTYELAEAHPYAHVLVSGGAVQNKYVEAVEMKQYLVDAGLKEERLVSLKRAKDTVGNVHEFMEYIATRKFKRICAVTSLEHLPRAWMSLYVGLKNDGYAARLFGAAAEKNTDPEIMEQEARLSYQTVFRVVGLFEKKDIERHLHTQRMPRPFT